MQVSEAGDFLLLSNLPVLGVHRPPVAGIHATTECAWSISMKTGGYEDDEDGGEEFVYTGPNFSLQIPTAARKWRKRFESWKQKSW